MNKRSRHLFSLPAFLALCSMIGCEASGPTPESDHSTVTINGVTISRTPRDSEVTGIVRPDMGLVEVRDRNLVDVVDYFAADADDFVAIAGTENLPAGNYDITFNVERAETKPWEVLKPALEEAFHVRFRLVKRPMEVYVLRVREDKPLALSPEKPGELPRSFTTDTSAGFGTRFINVGMDYLARWLGGVVPIKQSEGVAWTNPVMNETGIEGHYCFDVIMSFFDEQKVFKGLERLGLGVVPAKRDCTVLLVEKTH